MQSTRAVGVILFICSSVIGRRGGGITGLKEESKKQK